MKTGQEILDEYFKKLSQDATIDQNLRKSLATLWAEQKLYSKVSLVRVLDELRKEKGDEQSKH